MSLADLPPVVLAKIFELLACDPDRLRLRLALGNIAHGSDAWVPLASNPLPTQLDIQDVLTGGGVIRDLALRRLRCSNPLDDALLRVVLGDVLVPTVSVYGASAGPARIEAAAATLLKMLDTVAHDFRANNGLVVRIENVCLQLAPGDLAYNNHNGPLVTVDTNVYSTTPAIPYPYRLILHKNNSANRLSIAKQVFLVSLQVLLYICGMLPALGSNITKITLRRKLCHSPLPQYPTTTLIYATGNSVHLPHWYAMLLDLGNLSRHSKTFNTRGRVSFRVLAKMADVLGNEA